MKKTIIFIGALFFTLMALPSYAQKTTKEKKESKTVKTQKTESSKVRVLDKVSSKSAATKVEERGVATPDHNHINVEEKELGAGPGFFNPRQIKSLSNKFTYKNSHYQLKVNDKEIYLYKDNMSSVYAKLVPTQKEGLYRYTSSTKNGAAHFDAKGNLVLKYLDNDSGKTKEIKFRSN